MSSVNIANVNLRTVLEHFDCYESFLGTCMVYTDLTKCWNLKAEISRSEKVLKQTKALMSS